MLLFRFQSVDNEIVLWEPKMKDQSPGEVRIPYNYCTSDLSVSNLYQFIFMDIFVDFNNPSSAFCCYDLFRVQLTSFRNILFQSAIFGSSSFHVIFIIMQLL